jgi:hypothetical protein
VDPSNPGVDQRVDRCIRVGRCARVVREIEHGRDAGIERGQRSQPGAHVHVMRCVLGSDAGEGRHHVLAEIGHVGDAATQLGFPSMPVAVDKAGADDRAAGVDDEGRSGDQAVLRVRSKIGTDRDDVRTDDQNVTGFQVGGSWIHGHNGAAGEEDRALRITGSAELCE